MRTWMTAQLLLTVLAACGPASEAPPIDEDDIAGVVMRAGEPEAGVWVIAETDELATRFARIVVTDDRGRVPHTRPARSQLRRVGTRLRARGFREA